MTLPQIYLPGPLEPGDLCEAPDDLAVVQRRAAPDVAQLWRCVDVRKAICVCVLAASLSAPCLCSSVSLVGVALSAEQTPAVPQLSTATHRVVVTDGALELEFANLGQMRVVVGVGAIPPEREPDARYLAGVCTLVRDERGGLLVLTGQQSTLRLSLDAPDLGVTGMTDLFVACFRFEPDEEPSPEGVTARSIMPLVPLDAAGRSSNYVHVTRSALTTMSATPVQDQESHWAPSYYPDEPSIPPSDLAGRGVNDCMRERMKAADNSAQYHVFLYPNGRVFDPEGGAPWVGNQGPANRLLHKSAVRGQRIYVHWLVPEDEADNYTVEAKGEAYRPGARHNGSFQGLTKPQPTKREDRVVETNPYMVWRTFVLGPFEGGDFVTVSRYCDAKKVGQDFKVYFRRQDRFNLRAGAIWTDLGDKEAALAPSRGTTRLAQGDRGPQVQGALSVVIDPWGDRDFEEPGRGLHKLNLVVGTTMESFTDTWFYGLSYEIAPRFDIVAGRISGKVKTLSPGYQWDSEYTGTDLPLMDRRDEDWFLGFTFDTDLYRAIFQ